MATSWEEYFEGFLESLEKEETRRGNKLELVRDQNREDTTNSHGQQGRRLSLAFGCCLIFVGFAKSSKCGDVCHC